MLQAFGSNIQLITFIMQGLTVESHV